MRPARLSPVAFMVIAASLASCGGEAPMNEPDPDPTPVVSRAQPEFVPREATLEVTVTGTGFETGSTAEFLLNGVPDPNVRANSVRVVSATQMVVSVTVATEALPATRAVAVTTPRGKKGIGTEKIVILYGTSLEAIGAPGTDVNSVAANGLIAGSVESDCYIIKPALWEPTGRMTLLPLLPGTCGGNANDVNSRGTVVGSGYQDNTPITDVRWVLSGGAYSAQPIPALPDGQRAGLRAINEAGQVVSFNYAALYQDERGWTMLPSLPGASICRTVDINDAAEMVGVCVVEGNPRAVYWASATADPVLLPYPGEGISGAFVSGLNNAGVAVGWVLANVPSAPVLPVRWTRSGDTWVATVLRHLGAGGSAYGINNLGQVAGGVNATTGTGYERPALWESDGALIQLESNDGVGGATGLSDTTDPLVIAGYVRTGKEAGFKILVAWLRSVGDPGPEASARGGASRSKYSTK